MDDELRTVPDETLAEWVGRSGREDAAEELFRRYQKRVYLWSYNYIRNPEDALDCAQAIFIKIFRGLEGFAGRSSFSTWVYGIARNHCLTELGRAGSRARRRSIPIEEVEITDRSSAEELRRAELAGELESLLRRASERLRPEELEAFVLHYRDGLSIKEITRILGCENPSGARTLIQTARRRFARMRGKEENVH